MLRTVELKILPHLKNHPAFDANDELKKYRESGPVRATDGSAGYDLRACISESIALAPGEYALIPTGISIHINHASYAGIAVPRSGLGSKKGIVLGNLVGVLDSDFMGEWFVSLWNRNQKGFDYNERKVDVGIFYNQVTMNIVEPFVINPGDRICQMLIMPVVHPGFKVVDEFTAKLSDRGAGGLGHTGQA